MMYGREHTIEILRGVLGGGMVISRDPEGHGWQLISLIEADYPSLGMNCEVMVQHENWDTFLSLCEEYI